MGARVVRAFLALILMAFLSFAWDSPKLHADTGKPMITGFNGSKIKLYKKASGKDIWEKVPAKQLSGTYAILESKNNRYKFEFKDKNVWVKRKNARTNGVKSGLPPCPKLASVKTQAAGNAVSRGSGKGCK